MKRTFRLMVPPVSAMRAVSNHDRKSGMKAGAVDFLSKPFREQDMLDAVTLAIETDRTRRARTQASSDVRDRFEIASCLHVCSPPQRSISPKTMS